MKKLLIVDDNAQNLYLLEVLLKTNGFEVEQASNGVEALELARSNPPDLIISDILMPDMDGFSLCRTWKADERLKEIPFIFYTATYTDSRDEKLALSLGAERFLVKPLDWDIFLSILQEIFQKYESGAPTLQPDMIETDDEFYREYNAALIRKLEDKMMQLQRSNRRLASLYKVSCELHTTKSPAELLDIALQAIIETAGLPYANYFTYDPHSKTLSLSATIGFSDETLTTYIRGIDFKLGDRRGLVGFVAQTGQPLNISDTSQDPDWIVLDSEIRSVLFAPVHFENRLQGVIGLYSKEKQAFTEEDIHDITALANNLAVVFENRNNQEQVKKQLTRISALHNIDLAINSSMDLHNTLHVVLDHVRTQLKADAADMLLSQANAPIYEFTAGRGFLTRNIEKNHIRMGRSLDKQAAIERRIIHVTELTDQMVSPAFMSMWVSEGFQTYFGAPLIAKGKVVGVLEVFQRSLFEPDDEWFDYFETLASQAAIAIDNARMFSDLQRSNMELSIAYDATIKGWSRAMDLRDQETEGHTQRVTEITVRLAGLMGISEQMIHIRRGALLHDIGKLGVPDSILLKPGKLTDEEWVIMRKHPQFAYEMLLPIDYLNPALDIPYCHHEKWDGTGYPRGLKGEQIPLPARVFAVVDVWDALRSDRTYRKAWQEEEVMAYIREQSGKHFDPHVVEKFFQLLDELKRQRGDSNHTFSV